LGLTKAWKKTRRFTSIMLLSLITYRSAFNPGLRGEIVAQARDSVAQSVCESCPEAMIIMITRARVHHHRAAGNLDHAGRAKPTVPKGPMRWCRVCCTPWVTRNAVTRQITWGRKIRRWGLSIIGYCIADHS
jgi:hypothetical protein